GKTNKPKSSSPIAHFEHFILKHSDAISFHRTADLVPVVPPIVISEYGVDAKRCAKIFKDGRKYFRLHLRATVAARYVVAKNDNNIWIQFIRAFDDQPQLILIDERASSMNVRKDSDL